MTVGAVVELDSVRSRRVANLTGEEKCRHCLDDAVLIVGTETRRPVLPATGTFEVEVAGPCPFCERGYRLEFGASPDARTPWGPAGYWRGRSLPEAGAA